MKPIVGVGVLLQTDRQTFLLQERDEHARMNPGRIAAFGGGIEAGEEVHAAARRELVEELSLSVTDAQLEDIGVWESHQLPGRCIQIFRVRGISAEGLVLAEGKGIIELSLDQALVHPQVTEFTKEVLQALVG